MSEADFDDPRAQLDHPYVADGHHQEQPHQTLGFLDARLLESEAAFLEVREHLIDLHSVAVLGHGDVIGTIRSQMDRFLVLSVPEADDVERSNTLSGQVHEVLRMDLARGEGDIPQLNPCPIRTLNPFVRSEPQPGMPSLVDHGLNQLDATEFPISQQIDGTVWGEPGNHPRQQLPLGGKVGSTSMGDVVPGQG